MKILFVCLGNICRSPAAEGVFLSLLEKEGVSKNFVVDSAGTSAHHAGEPADARMRKHALKRGIELRSISRQFNPDEDFERFDLILAMDEINAQDMMDEAPDAQAKAKIKTMVSYCKKHKVPRVPDPYYGGPEGFETVLDILEDACWELLAEIKKKSY